MLAPVSTVVLVQYIGDTLLPLARVRKLAKVLLRRAVAAGLVGPDRIVDALPGPKLAVERRTVQGRPTTW
jgi:hypothetical protein